MRNWLAVASADHPILDTFFIFLGANPPTASAGLVGWLVLEPNSGAAHRSRFSNLSSVKHLTAFL